MHSTRRSAAVGLAVLVGASATLPAQQATVPARPAILSLEEETRLALSAAPEYLREKAGVVALTENGFVTVRETGNGFTCVVNRDHPLNWKPTCYDAEGTATILPKVRFVGELLLRGVALKDIDERVQAKFARGEFISPRRTGVAYMLSKEIRNYNPNTGKVGGFPPHVMFYAPNVTNQDIGTSFEAHQAHPWLPFVAYEGPQGFFVVIVGDLERTARHESTP